MPFKVPLWVCTLTPLIRRVNAASDASDDKPSTSNTINNDQVGDLPNDPNLLQVPGFPEPGLTVEAPQGIVQQTRNFMNALLAARRQRAPFPDERERSNERRDLDSLPFMSREEFQNFWDSQDSRIFGTHLRNQEFHMLNSLNMAARLCELEQKLEAESKKLEAKSEKLRATRRKLAEAEEAKEEAFKQAVKILDTMYKMKKKMDLEKNNWKLKKALYQAERAEERDSMLRHIGQLQADRVKDKIMREDLRRCSEQLEALNREYNAMQMELLAMMGGWDKENEDPSESFPSSPQPGPSGCEPVRELILRLSSRPTLSGSDQNDATSSSQSGPSGFTSTEQPRATSATKRPGSDHDDAPEPKSRKK